MNMSEKETTKNINTVWRAADESVPGETSRAVITLLRLIVDSLSYSMKPMYMVNAQGVTPLIQDISSPTDVTLSLVMGKHGLKNLKIGITPLDIKVKLPKSGAKKSTKRK